MTIVDEIFAAFGRPADVAKETGFPTQTVWEWKNRGRIPHWRRAAVIAAAQRLGITLSAECAAYLTSRDEMAA